jgi:hypothetical protein
MSGDCLRASSTASFIVSTITDSGRGCAQTDHPVQSPAISSIIFFPSKSIFFFIFSGANIVPNHQFADLYQINKTGTFGNRRENAQAWFDFALLTVRDGGKAGMRALCFRFLGIDFRIRANDFFYAAKARRKLADGQRYPAGKKRSVPAGTGHIALRAVFTGRASSLTMNDER